MWLTVEHVTRFAYDASINEAYTEIRLKPAHRDGQRCSSFALATEPRGVSIAEYRDRFGNAVHHFDVLEPHQNARRHGTQRGLDAGGVRRRRGGAVAARSLGSPPREPLRAARGLRWRSSRRRSTPSGPDARDGARADDGRPRADEVRDRLDARADARRRGALRRARRLPGLRARADRRLPAARDPGAIRQRLPLRPARQRERQLGLARVGRRLGARARWVSLDPTHDREQTERYVRVGVGRDYADVPPTRGVYKGKAKEELEVAVRIREL